MRAKKGTRIATATELLLVEPLVSGSVSVMFSLSVKPTERQTFHVQSSMCNILWMQAQTMQLKQWKKDTYLDVMMTTMMMKMRIITQARLGSHLIKKASHFDHTDNHHCDCDNRVENNHVVMTAEMMSTKEWSTMMLKGIISCLLHECGKMRHGWHFLGTKKLWILPLCFLIKPHSF